MQHVDDRPRSHTLPADRLKWATAKEEWHVCCACQTWMTISGYKLTFTLPKALQFRSSLLALRQPGMIHIIISEGPTVLARLVHIPQRINASLVCYCCAVCIRSCVHVQEGVGVGGCRVIPFFLVMCDYEVYTVTMRHNLLLLLDEKAWKVAKGNDLVTDALWALVSHRYCSSVAPFSALFLLWSILELSCGLEDFPWGVVCFCVCACMRQSVCAPSQASLLLCATVAALSVCA